MAYNQTGVKGIINSSDRDLYVDTRGKQSFQADQNNSESAEFSNP